MFTASSLLLLLCFFSYFFSSFILNFSSRTYLTSVNTLFALINVLRKDRLVFKCYLLSYTTHLMLTGSLRLHITARISKYTTLCSCLYAARLHRNAVFLRSSDFNSSVSPNQKQANTTKSARVYVVRRTVYAFRLEDDKAQTTTTDNNKCNNTQKSVNISKIELYHQ